MKRWYQTATFTALALGLLLVAMASMGASIWRTIALVGVGCLFVVQSFHAVKEWMAWRA